MIGKDFLRVQAQILELQRAMAAGRISPLTVRPVLQSLLEEEEFVAVNERLLPVENQLNLVREYNARYWGRFFSEEQLNAVGTEPTCRQRITHLDVLHVSFDSLEQTVEMWARVLEPLGCEFSAELWGALDKARSALFYPPGIQRVTLDLLANWDIQAGRTAEEARVLTRVDRVHAAQAEVLSALGLNVEVLSFIAARKLPSIGMPGFAVNLPRAAEEWAHSLTLQHSLPGKYFQVTSIPATQSFDQSSQAVVLS